MNNKIYSVVMINEDQIINVGGFSNIEDATIVSSIFEKSIVISNTIDKNVWLKKFKDKKFFRIFEHTVENIKDIIAIEYSLTEILIYKKELFSFIEQEFKEKDELFLGEVLFIFSNNKEEAINKYLEIKI